MKHKGPVLVRAKPGTTTIEARARTRPGFRALRFLLLVIGLCGVGMYGYSIANQYVYQKYENWAFDRHISGHEAVTFVDFLRQETPLGLLLGRDLPSAPVRNSSLEDHRSIARPEHGSVLGRLEVPRLHISAIVREGVDAETLSEAVGHVPSTALGGEPGNFAIAAHRDTLFRGLKDVQQGDLVTFESPEAVYTYRIVSMRIVKPSDVAVLRPDGGFGVHLENAVYGSGTESDARRLITMITCYPFYYVGSAPKRFIVQGELISTCRTTPTAPQEARNLSPPKKKAVGRRNQIRPSHQARIAEPRRNRGSSRISSTPPISSTSVKPRKHGFWHKVLHL